jgi:protein transport protein SEC31
LLALIYTYSQNDDQRINLCHLGDRLERFSAKTNDEKSKFSAILCYLAAGDLVKVATMWTSKSHVSTASLQSLMEKISVFRKAIGYADPELYAEVSEYRLKALYDSYLEYIHLLSVNGKLDIAWKISELLPQQYYNPEKRLSVAELRDRIYHSGALRIMVNPPQSALQQVYVYGDYTPAQSYHDQKLTAGSNPYTTPRGTSLQQNNYGTQGYKQGNMPSSQQNFAPPASNTYQAMNPQGYGAAPQKTSFQPPVANPVPFQPPAVNSYQPPTVNNVTFQPPVANTGPYQPVGNHVPFQQQPVNTYQTFQPSPGMSILQPSMAPNEPPRADPMSRLPSTPATPALTKRASDFTAIPPSQKPIMDLLNKMIKDLLTSTTISVNLFQVNC